MIELAREPDGSYSLPLRRRALLCGSGRLLALVVIFLFCVHADAMAHAVLLASQPGENSLLADSPGAIELTFNEPVQILALRIIDSNGRDQTPPDPPTVVDERVTLPLSATLPQGRYVVSWRVGSLDGHVVGGSFGFGIGEAVDSDGPPVSAPSDDAWRWGVVALRALSRVLLLFVVGLALFRLLMSPPATLQVKLQLPIRWLAFSGFLASLAMIAADGALRTGEGLSDMLTLEAWRAEMIAPTAWLQGSTLVGLLLLAGFRRGLLQGFGALLSLGTLATQGHVLAVLSAGVGQALMIGHGLAAALWVGAIWPLRVALAQDASPATAALFRRFQTLGAAAVSGVVLSGIAMAWILLPHLSDLWQSDYGLRLCMKLIAVGLMLAVAVLNRVWLTRHALTGLLTMRQRLLTVLRLDLVIAVVVVILAVGLSIGPPPLHGVALDLSDERYSVQVNLLPGRVGDNAADIWITSKHGGPEPRAIELRIAAPEHGIEPMRRQAERISRGHYRAAGMSLLVAGPWQVAVTILVDDFTRTQIETEIELTP